MNETELRQKLHEIAVKIKPIIEQMNELVMEAYRKGFIDGLDLGLEVKKELKEKTEE